MASNENGDTSNSTLVPFEELWEFFPSKFSKTERDLAKKYSELGHPSMSRYMLIRSMDKQHLAELTGLVESEGMYKLAQTAYETTSITIQDIISFIREKWDEGANQRLKENDELITKIEKIPRPRNTAIRNDEVKVYINRQMRDIPDPDLMETILNTTYEEMINYVNWTAYNTLTTKIMELFCNRDLPVNFIPVLRDGGIIAIDFFVVIDDTIYPFDLKVTHIGNDYFDKHPLMTPATEGTESFTGIDDAENTDTEIGLIKQALSERNNRIRATRNGHQQRMDEFVKERYKEITDGIKDRRRGLIRTLNAVIGAAYKSIRGQDRSLPTQTQLRSDHGIGAFEVMLRNIPPDHPMRPLIEQVQQMISEVIDLPTQTELRSEHGIGALEVMVEHIAEHNAPALPQINVIQSEIASLDNIVTLKQIMDEHGSSNPDIKWPILKILSDSPEGSVDRDRILAIRTETIESLRENRAHLEWTNMVGQGPVNFQNNNRLFIFLCHPTNVGNEGDARVLRLNVEQLTKELFDHIKDLTEGDLNNNLYTYKSTPPSDYDGVYSDALTTSILILGDY